ncbi:GntR family transcriptional regulator [Jiangella rhizosphaerae]|uniref:GntR family transcriptional regulator n=1 Tax=Jiangella rhizosphaerae TaxID=2293569 RepID=A0A418KG82_9ACTN|nr:GntR family transcriptional regulator [Jiangella rhizosphaerae]RIQ11008.1 GntR family transcriptional regulator [Jiangella rhizosphaerae]
MRRDSAAQSALLRLRHLIATEFAPGDRLPPEKELAEALEVSRTTVREALVVLAAEDIVTRQWGAGTFVSEPPKVASLNMSAIESYRDRVGTGGRTVTLLDASCELVPPPAASAAVLQLDAGAKAWHVRRLFAVDGSPSALMSEIVPAQLFGRPIDPSPMLRIETSLYELLNRHTPGAAMHASTELEAVCVRGDDARALDLDDGAPVLQATQTTFARRGEPVAHGVSLQRTDLVRMRITR